MDITLYKEKLDEGKKLYSNTWESIYIYSHTIPQGPGFIFQELSMHNLQQYFLSRLTIFLIYYF